MRMFVFRCLSLVQPIEALTSYRTATQEPFSCRLNEAIPDHVTSKEDARIFAASRVAAILS